MLSASILALATLALPVQVARASYGDNLAFRSPYLNERSLEVDTSPIARRALRKRQVFSDSPPLQTKAVWEDESYRKYLGEVDHSNADYVYAGGLTFTHGVASGDPYDTSVILWTRVNPTESARIDVPACVEYKVSTKSDMSGDIVASGQAFTAFDIDWTVKVEASGLSPQTTYWYQWHNCANSEDKSVIGRTRTSPAKNADAEKVGSQRFAIYSCANFPNGFFNSYGGPVENDDVDFILHLGDYIYENKNPANAAKINRTVQPDNEIATVSDYRLRYGTYRNDPDLQANHKLFPWISVWDDHETANNDFKAGSSNTNDTVAGCSTVGVCFTEREANAKRAYFEWMPIRQVDIADQNRIWREFNFGSLVDLIALDTRKADRDITDLDYNIDYVQELAEQTDTKRSIVGPKQREWLLNTLDKSAEKGTKWRLLLNQVIFGSINHTATAADPTAEDLFVVNYDAWDGYQADRHRVLDHVYEKDIKNIIAITGDTHANWLFENNKDTVIYGNQQNVGANQVKREEGDYVRGQIVEFGGTAVSSSGWGSRFNTEQNATQTSATGLVRDSAGLLWSEGFYRGYMNLQISADNVTTTYYGYPDNQIMRTQNRTQLAKFSVKAGTNSVTRPLPKPAAGALKQGN